MERSKLLVKLPKVLPDIKIFEYNWKKENNSLASIPKETNTIELKAKDLLKTLKNIRIVSLTPTPPPSLLSPHTGMNMLQIIDRQSLETFKRRFQQNLCIRSSSKGSRIHSKRISPNQFSFYSQYQKDPLVETNKNTTKIRFKRKRHGKITAF